MDDGRLTGAPAGAVRAGLRGVLGLDQPDRRPRNRAHAGCRARTCAESVRDHRPQPVGNRRDRPRHSRCRHHLARTGAAPAAERARRLAAAGEIDLDLRRQGPRAGQQPGVAAARNRFFRPRLFQAACRRRHRHAHRRRADAASALSGRAVLRRQPPPPDRRRQLRRRDPGFGAAGIFREFLRQDRPRARQLLRAGPDRRHGAGSPARGRPRSSARSSRTCRAEDRRQSQGGTHHRDIAGRRDRAPGRVPETCRLSGLCQRRARDLGDPGALALHHGPASDLRPARHRAVVSDSGAGAAADPQPVRRGGPPRGRRGSAEARPTPRSARTAHRRRRP